MANTKNAQKAQRQSERRRTENRFHGKTTRNAIKKLRLTTDKAEAKKSLPGVVSLIDKLAKKNVIHKNKAANLKRKLAKKVNAAK